MKRKKHARLRVVLACPAGGVDEVHERRLGLGPATGLETTVGVDEQEARGEDVEHLGDAVLDLLLGGDTRRVDIVDTGADLVGVTVVPEGGEELHVALRCFNGDNVSVETLDRGEDVIEVGIAEVGVSLGSVADTSSRKLESVNGPTKVVIPVNTAERQLNRKILNL